MPNVVALLVEEPDQIRNAGAYDTGAVIRLQWSATEAGAYADVSGTGSTPTTAVVTGIRSYTAYDPNGTVSTYYRTRFENTGATRLSDWSASFQVAEEGSGLICSLSDVKQALGLGTSTTEDESILEHIRQITSEIQRYTGRRFVRSPANGTTTFLFDVDRASRTLWVPAGIATVSQVEVATQTGGAFAIVTAADWWADPPTQDRTFGWPATRITISDIPTGSIPYFYAGKRTARLTMALGWDTVPYDVAAIGARATIASYLSKDSGAGGVAAVGPEGRMTILRNISPADRGTLTEYRVINV